LSTKSRTAEDIDWDELEDRIKYQFRDRKKLIQAFTRKAHAKEREEDSERMGKGKKFPHQDTFRVLGDAVLKAALVDLLLKNEDLDTRGKITEEKKQY
jgi:dsRNA-specific ribonuclease